MPKMCNIYVAYKEIQKL